MDIKRLGKNLGFSFKNENFFIEALTHRSYLNEHARFGNSNERLEFLGDAILELWVSKQLFVKFSQVPEGVLTDIRSKIVRTSSLAGVARDLKLGNFLLLSKGEEGGGGRENPTLLANTFEALLGAIFCDQGIEKVEDFLTKYIGPKIEEITLADLKDDKSKLQEISQEKFRITPVYDVLESSGPDHAKTFCVGVYLGKKLVGEGKGKSKREAELAAAKDALAKLKLGI
ncbi:ribonuclease III [Candidatus Shapirobacteria bacterium]|nr:ribonuclease III [Candidatus Shapirobacteria bacterium]